MTVPHRNITIPNLSCLCVEMANRQITCIVAMITKFSIATTGGNDCAKKYLHTKFELSRLLNYGGPLLSDTLL